MNLCIYKFMCLYICMFINFMNCIFSFFFLSHWFPLFVGFLTVFFSCIGFMRWGGVVWLGRMWKDPVVVLFNQNLSGMERKEFIATRGRSSLAPRCNSNPRPLGYAVVLPATARLRLVCSVARAVEELITPCEEAGYDLCVGNWFRLRSLVRLQWGEELSRASYIFTLSRPCYLTQPLLLVLAIE
jgi:hypothetical protein